MEPLFATVDLGGTNTACALATAEGRIVAECTAPTNSHEGPAGVLERIGSALESLAAESGARPAALGMGVPGLVDRARGVTLFLPNMPTQWRGVAVAECLGGRLRCPVYLLNDVRTATLGELTYGCGKGIRNMIFFALGTGIGGGVVVDGVLRLGPLGAAGELGHQTILPEGPACGCGNRGCLETLASGPAISAQGVWLMWMGRAPELHRICGGSADAVNPKRMAEAAAAGDEAVRDIILRAAGYIAIGVANVVQALHPELVVVGGGVAGIGPMLMDAVRTEVVRRIGMFPAHDVRIETSLLGDKAGLFGGIALAARGGSLD